MPALGREPNGVGFVAPTTAKPRPAWLAQLPAKVLVVDVETTGLTNRDRLVSFAGVLLETEALGDGKFQLRYMHSIFDPGRKSHPKAEAVHGYSDWVLRHQEPFVESAETIARLFEEADVVVAHNAEFDIEFINREFEYAGYPRIAKPIFCTMTAYRQLGTWESASLSAVARRIGLGRRGERHGALEDAWLALMVYLWLHNCPYRIPFDTVSPEPWNLRPVPPMPEGPLPRRKRRPKRRNVAVGPEMTARGRS